MGGDTVIDITDTNVPKRQGRNLEIWSLKKKREFQNNRINTRESCEKNCCLSFWR